MHDESSLFARERSALITRRLEFFAIGWLGALGIWLLVFAVEGRLTMAAVVLAGVAAAALASALSLCRSGAHAGRETAIVVATCVVLGLTAMAMVDAVDAYGEILAFLLLTLYLAAALLFSWGWRAELVLLVTTLVPWTLVLHRFELFVPRLELAAAVTIGASLALAIAEGAARNFRTVFRRRRAQERATQALQASRDAYRDLAETARDVIWSADLEGRLTYANEALERFLGLSAAELLGRSLGDFYSRHPDNPDFAAIIARGRAGEVLPLLLIEVATPRGPRWVEVMSSAIRDAGGAVIGFRGISRDVHERREAELALRASEERFRSAFDHAAIGMLVVGLNGKPVQANRAFCEMLGYDRPELASRTMDTLSHPDDSPPAAAEVARLLRGEVRAFQMEKRYLHKDGHLVWCLFSCSLAHDADGRHHLIAQVQDISERKAAEDALRASESRYRGLVESQHELIVRMDAGGHFTFVNDAYAAKFGKTQPELLGQSFLALVHPDDQAVVADAVAAMARPPHRVVVEIRNLTAEGPRWISWEGGVVLDDRGRMVEAQAVGRDVTERRAADDALRASEARYRGLVESAHELVTRFDRAGRLTFANDSYCQAVGYARADIVGRNPMFLVHPGDQAATLASFKAVLEPPYRCRTESRARTPYGWRWFEWEISGVRDAGEEIVEIQQVGRDVTARRNFEAQLRESEERFRSAFDDAAIGMGVTTVDGRALRVNAAFCAMFGYTENEMVGRALDDIVHPDDRVFLREDLTSLLGGRVRTYRAERRYLRADGQVLWAVATASVIRDPNGKPLYLIGQLQDVTERRLAEEALRESLADLRRSEETLRLLARRQVAIREQERKRLGLDLHDDVCQELVGVGILVESLRRKVSPMAVEHAAEFDRVVKYLGEVVEHLRLLARELRPLLLHDLGLDGSLRSLADGMSSATLRVATEIHGPVPRLDEEVEVTVYRIAQETLANAARHAAASRIVIALGVGDGMLQLEISDDGRGFDPAARPSAALGLTSMEERALALGGRLRIVSAPGAGTTVTLTCPVAVRPSGPSSGPVTRQELPHAQRTAERERAGG